MDAPESTSPLISDSYRSQQERLHANGNYGLMGTQYAPLIAQILHRTGAQHLLDYGCGQCSLAKALKVPHKITYQAYDPCVPRFSAPPVPAELVCCIDVLEHIEPDKLDAVLDDLARLTEAVAFLSVDTGPAVKFLDDGRNAHLIQEPMSWWLPKIWQRWDLQTVQQSSEHSFYVIALAKTHLEQPDGSRLCQ